MESCLLSPRIISSSTPVPAISKSPTVRGIEYGQNAGRRLGLAIVVSPLFLLSKKRRHFLTVHFVDPRGASQAAVFELGKKIVRTTLAALEARTGLSIEYEDEEARKAGGI